MNRWMGLNTNLYNDLVGEPKPSILGAFISSVEHQEKLVGTWEVGTPRRVVVAKQNMLVLKKGLCGGAKSWGGLCFACNLSNLRGKLVGGWRSVQKM